MSPRSATATGAARQFARIKGRESAPCGRRAGIDAHHVLEALVVGGVEEDLGLQAAPGVAVVHGLPAARLIAAVVQRRADVVHRHLCKRRRIALLPHARRHLPQPHTVTADSPSLTDDAIMTASCGHLPS